MRTLLSWVRAVMFVASVLVLVPPTAASAQADGEGILLMTPYKWSDLSDGQRAL